MSTRKQKIEVVKRIDIDDHWVGYLYTDSGAVYADPIFAYDHYVGEELNPDLYEFVGTWQPKKKIRGKAAR